jgi:2'-5' RNA ligase
LRESGHDRRTCPSPNDIDADDNGDTDDEDDPELDDDLQDKIDDLRNEGFDFSLHRERASPSVKNCKQILVMNKKELSEYMSKLARKSVRARKKNPKKFRDHMKLIASKGGKNRWKKGKGLIQQTKDRSD